MGQAILTGKSGVNYLLKTGQVAYGSFKATSSTSPSYTFPNIGFQPTAMCIWTDRYLDYSGYDYTSTTRFCPYIAKINDAPFDVFVSGGGDIDENLVFYVNSDRSPSATVKQENTITCTYDAATDSVIVTCGYNPNSDAYRCVPWYSTATMWFLFMNGEAQSITTTAQTTALQVPSKKQPQVGLAYCDKRSSNSKAWIQLCLPDYSFYADGYTQNNKSGYHHKINGGKMTFDAANEMAIFAAPSWTAGTTYYMLG